MARIFTADKVDNGFIIQTDPTVEGQEGIFVTQSQEEFIARLVELTVAATGTLTEVVPLTHVPVTTVDSEQSAQPAPGSPEDIEENVILTSVEGFTAEAQLMKLVADNDRDGARAILDPLVEAGYAEAYKPRNGIKKMVQDIIAAEKIRATSGAPAPATEAPPPAENPLGAPPPAVDPLGAPPVPPTAEEFGGFLREQSTKLNSAGKDGMKLVVGILGKFNAKVLSDIQENQRIECGTAVAAMVAQELG